VTDLDRLIHEPARLLIVALLAGVREADFVWVHRESGLTKGNLSNHLAKLAEAGYVDVEKTYRGRVPLTVLRLTRQGKGAFERYKKTLNGVLTPAPSRTS
jgi:DNA-binding transcriptional ArsR family regulator